MWKDGHEGVYITPTLRHARACVAAGADIVAIDATDRPRPDGKTVEDTFRPLHEEGVLLMADCATIEDIRRAVDMGFDLVSTTLSHGVAAIDCTMADGPDLPLLRQATEEFPGLPIICEAACISRSARAAIDASAWAVIVGTAITHPRVLQVGSRLRLRRKPGFVSARGGILNKQIDRAGIRVAGSRQQKFGRQHMHKEMPWMRRSARASPISSSSPECPDRRTQAMHTCSRTWAIFASITCTPASQLAELVSINTGVGRHLAVTCDLRSQGLFDELLDAVAALEEREMSCDIVFLEASDEVLIRRYSENRRRHPIAKPGETTADAIQRERLQLQGVRDRADMIIDTSRLRTSALRNKLRMAFSELSDQQLMDVHVFSFGFKHGMPVEADIMIDVRFLPNPFYDPEMRTMTGLDKKVSDFVLDHPKTQEFWKTWTQLLDTVMPGYIAEGKPQLSIAIGCTGGQHRSVAIAEATARYLEGAQYHVSISHRDLSRANTKA